MGAFDKMKKKIKMLENGLVHGRTSLTYLELGLLYQTVKEYDKAEKAFKKVITALPDNIYPRFLLLRLYEAQGQKDEAYHLAEELMQSAGPRISLGLRLELSKILSSDSDKVSGHAKIKEYAASA